MYFRILHDEVSGAASYLLADLESRAAVLVDPRGADLAVLQAMLDEHRLRLHWVLRTHEHDSHRPGDVEAEALLALDAPCVAHQLPPGAGAILPFGNEHLRVLVTPGHTRSCLSFLWRDRLFCGDVFSVDACPDQPGPAWPEALWESATQHIFMLPAETLLFSAHAQSGHLTSSVLEQRRSHPWFAGASRDEFLARVRRSAAALSRLPGLLPSQQLKDSIHE